MSELSLDLRRRIVAAYRSGQTKTYEETAAMFRVGYASVSRLLRRERESGDVLAKPRGGNNPRRVDLVWLKAHALKEPDARLVDRIAAFAAHSGKRVSMAAMHGALHAIGWSHKKRRQWLESASVTTSKSDEPRSSRSKGRSTRRG